MLLAATAGFATLIASGAYVVAYCRAATSDPVAIFFGLLANLTFIPSLVLVIVGVPLLFPDGRFLSPRWRWVARPVAVVVLAAELRVLVGRWNSSTEPGLAEPVLHRGLRSALRPGQHRRVAWRRFRSSRWRSGRSCMRYRRADDVGRTRSAGSPHDCCVAVARVRHFVLRAARASMRVVGGLGHPCPERDPAGDRDRRRPLSAVRHRPADQPRHLVRARDGRPARDVRRCGAHPARSARAAVRDADGDRRHLDARHRWALPARSLAHPPGGRSPVRPRHASTPSGRRRRSRTGCAIRSTSTPSSATSRPRRPGRSGRQRRATVLPARGS